MTSSPGFRVRTNVSPDDRAAERARARERRAAERVEIMAQRLEVRARSREAEIAERERVRAGRREEEMRRASCDPHAAAAERHRASGRKDMVREQRDTRSFTTLVDEGRVRELARRGASVTGLAGAFGITPDEVRSILDAAE